MSPYIYTHNSKSLMCVALFSTDYDSCNNIFLNLISVPQCYIIKRYLSRTLLPVPSVFVCSCLGNDGPRTAPSMSLATHTVNYQPANAASFLTIHNVSQPSLHISCTVFHNRRCIFSPSDRTAHMHSLT